MATPCAVSTGNDDPTQADTSHSASQSINPPFVHAIAVAQEDMEAMSQNLCAAARGDGVIDVINIESALSGIKGRNSSQARKHVHVKHNKVSQDTSETSSSVQLKRLQLDHSLGGHTAAASCVAFSWFGENGKFVISGGNDASVKLWDWRYFGAHQGEPCKCVSINVQKKGWVSGRAGLAGLDPARVGLSGPKPEPGLGRLLTGWVGSGQVHHVRGPARPVFSGLPKEKNQARRPTSLLKTEETGDCDGPHGEAPMLRLVGRRRRFPLYVGRKPLLRSFQPSHPPGQAGLQDPSPACVSETVPIPSSPPPSRRSIFFLLAIGSGALVSTATAAFLLSSGDADGLLQDRPQDQSRRLYSDLEEAIGRPRESFHWVSSATSAFYDRIVQTGVAASVLWKSLCSVLSLANQSIGGNANRGKKVQPT
ncbi:hypothetical protein EJ110_NYTH46412 [Nymphaea thermarum]|nr:hypothetical protein EJ110_NYTH46412 [Nymphaea thermarum]